MCDLMISPWPLLYIVTTLATPSTTSKTCENFTGMQICINITMLPCEIFTGKQTCVILTMLRCEIFTGKQTCVILTMLPCEIFTGKQTWVILTSVAVAQSQCFSNLAIMYLIK
jgi:hypothetical protein